MRDAIAAYVKRVKELADLVKGNEQATKKSLIEPLFTILGYDLADPRECVPEHREDFGRNRSAKPVDYLFKQGGVSVFVVEAKPVDRKLAGFDEQLADYFGKSITAKLGILTNGVHWRFFTDLDSENVMDRKPFVEWQVLSDEPPPWDFLTLLQKPQFDAELIRTFAERRHKQNLLIEKITQLLEPSTEFVRLAITDIETRYLKENVVEGWKPVLKAAIGEWAKQQRLSTALSDATPSGGEGPETPKRPIVTTQAELDAFATVQRLLGPDRPVEYEDTLAFFKIHLPGKAFWAVCRLVNFGEKKPSVWLPVTAETAAPSVPSLSVVPRGPRWCKISLNDVAELELLAQVLCRVWDQRWAAYGSGDEASDG